jgi:hypothetical protein
VVRVREMKNENQRAFRSDLNVGLVDVLL